MNRYHQRLCQSPGWAAFVADSLLPFALDGVPLGDRVLELGPGYGASTRPLAGRAGSLTALESDQKLAQRLRERLGDSVTVVDGDAARMAFGPATFTAVVCFTMLHHLPSRAAQDRLFAEAARVLQPGGVFAGPDSQPSLRFRLIHLADTCHPVDPGPLPGRLAAAGFSRIQVSTRPGAVRFVAYANGNQPASQEDSQ
jgi:SAM-dependent methyltransferase